MELVSKMNNISCGARFNQSDPFFHIGDKYGGIPLNLCTNLLGSLVLMVLFLIIRKNAVKSVKASLAVDARDSVENISMLLFGKDKLRKNKGNTDVKRIESNEGDIADTMGPDAIQYLTFQKFIIVYILFTTFISIGITATDLS